VLASDFDYPLPTQLIAQRPAPERDESRLLVLRRSDGAVTHHRFKELPQFLRAGDLLAWNDSKVIAARLNGRNHRSGGEFEVLLLEENSRNDWWVMLRPGKRARAQTRIDFKTRAGDSSSVSATVMEVNSEGHRRLIFAGCENILDELALLGQVPLPPYIARDSPDETDFDRYQTIYAHVPGSVAAPTAGLHFTPAVLGALRRTGVQICNVTLHVGLGTFAPVKTEELSGHVMHEERFIVSEETATRLNTAKAEGRRIIAVGTTSARVLESVAAANDGGSRTGSGRTRLFINPPYRFHLVDGLLTNFHLPRSTLLMLVSAFAAPGETRGRDLVLAAYHEAIAQRYRFFSYGDAMLIL
jgi:S-adenosylmethionine:tRNA ribosyltransferase-isomerase